MELFNLTDEEVWLKFMITLASNPDMRAYDIACYAMLSDEFLKEFKNRFRN